jgi:hypothetical protein
VNKLDAFWQSLPTADRYLINGRRWALVWRDGKGDLLPLAECLEQAKEIADADRRSNEHRQARRLLEEK